jgi:hypothetical protein
VVETLFRLVNVVKEMANVYNLNLIISSKSD